MNCKNFDFNLYFMMEDLVAQLKEQQVSEPSEIYTTFKNKLNEVGLSDVSDSELKEYFKASSFDANTIAKLNKYSFVEESSQDKETELNLGRDNSHLTEEVDIFDPNVDIDVKNVLVKEVKAAKTISSANDVYDNYFSGALLNYNRFRRNFQKKIFNSSLVSFDKNNSYVVKSNEQLNENIQRYKDSLLKDIADYLGEDNDAVSLLDSFQSKGIKNTDAFKSEFSDDDSLSKAYNAFIALSHFNELIPLYTTVVQVDKKTGEYTLTVDHKMKNNFSDSLVDIVSEVSKLVKSVVEFTPVLDKNGKEIKGRFLKLSEVTTVVGKLKDLSGDFLDASLNIRENVEENIAQLMSTYLNNPYLIKGLSKTDTDVIRTIYNFFYKDGTESDKVLSQMDENTVSLRSIKNDEYSNSNYCDYNLILDAITTTIDKTVSQTYVTIKEEEDGLKRETTKSITINKYFNELKNNFNSRSNYEINTIDGLTTNKSGIELKQVGNTPSFELVINGSPTIIKFNGMAEVASLGSILDINSDVNAEDIINYLNDGSIDKDKALFLDLLKSISDYTGINFFQNNGELILNSDITNKFIEEGLYNSARILYFRGLASEYSKALIADNDLTLSDFLSERNINISEDDVYGNRFTPFKTIKTTGFFKQTALGIATIKGDIASSISRNLNGDGLPNSSLLNLIGDYKTIFNQHKNIKQDEMISSNLFVQNNNYDLIEGTVFRSDIMMKDGTIKNVKNFNSGEILYQALFSDFWGNASEDGKVMLEPTVFADKSGQPMMTINMNKPFYYSRVDADGKVLFDTEGQTLFQLSSEKSKMGLKSKLDDLHFHTMAAQYQKLYDKLMGDYKFLISNMLLDGTNKVKAGKDSNGNPLFETVQSAVSKIVKNIDKLDIEQVRKVIGLGVQLEKYRKDNNGNEIDIQLEVHYANGDVNGYLYKKFKEYQVIDYDKNYYARRMNQEDKKFATFYDKSLGNNPVLKDNGEFKIDFENVVKSYLINSKNTPTDKLEKELKDFKEKWIRKDGTMKSSVSTQKGKDVELTETGIYDSSIVSEINPLLQVMQTTNRATMGNFNLAMVGGPHAHKMKTKKANVMKMFDPSLKDNAYTKNAQKYILQNLMDNGLSKEQALQEIWEEVEESARSIAMHKRMVAYQAKLHTFTQGLMTGVIKNMKMMVIKDVVKPVWNTVGVSGGFDVADGSGWVPMVGSLLFRNSMGDAGTDTVSIKAIRHAIDGDTGAAHLDKYAIQALTNEVLRQSTVSKRPWENLNKIMLDSIKFDSVFPGEVGNLFDPKYQINENAKTIIASIDSDTRQDVEKTNEFVRGMNTLPAFLVGRDIKYSIEGTNIITTLKGIAYDPTSGDYIIKKQFLGPMSGDQGITTEEGYTMVSESEGYKRVKLNTLYDIWTNVLGGMYSISENPHSPQLSFNGNNYSYSDDSNEALAAFMNDIVIKKDDNIVELLKEKGIETAKPNDQIKTYSQTNYYQPLKEALIWQINNASGMKNGAKNVNPNNIMTDPSIPANYFNTNSMHYGVQGNFDHKFSEEHEARVTEATQVISAAETNGYMTNDVNRLYKSLAQIIQFSVFDEKQALFKNDGEISELFARKMIKQMATKDRLGLAQAWGKLVDDVWKESKKKNPDFKYSEMDFKIAFTDPNFFGALVSTISGTFNSSVIRRDLPGLASVLSQADDAIMVVDSKGVTKMGNSLYKDKMQELLKDTKEKLKDPASRNLEISKLNAKLNEYKASLVSGKYGDNADTEEIDKSSINSYDIIRVKGENNKYIDFEITSPEQYYQIKDGDISSLPDYKELTGKLTFYTLSNIPRNLKSFSLKFATENGITLNEMDLDASRAVWNLKDLIKGKKVPKYISDLINKVAAKEGLEVNADNLDIIKKFLILEQQRQYALLNKNIFTYQGKELAGICGQSSGEIILPNYNQHKFGLEEGTALSDVTAEHFADKFKGFKEIHDRTSSFYLIDKKGDHVYLLNNDQFDSMVGKSKTNEDTGLKIKNINGTEYYVDSKGNIVFETIPGMRIQRLNGKLYATYSQMEDVNKLFSSDYYVKVGYNFNENNFEEIKSYIKMYDSTSSIYTMMNNHSDAKKEYDSRSDLRFENYINEIMSSWDKQLEMIGARIPAQSLQSFMAMKIVGFTEKNVNRAYVPIKKNWLDGSDFDIDKIYMSGFSVNRNGKLETWTNNFDFNHMELSLELPFPDGKVRDALVKEDSKLNVDLINDYAQKYLAGEETTGESFKEMIDMLYLTQDKKAIPAKGLSEEAISYIKTYFTSVITDKNRLLNSSKNAAVGALIKVSKAPVNFMSGNRGVDMDDPQAGAAKSPKTWAAMQWSMDNYATLPAMKEENGAGKAVIGISAVGIKVFYGLTHVNNQKVIQMQKEYGSKYSSYEEMKAKNPAEAAAVLADLKTLCSIKEFSLFNEKTGVTESVVTNLLANTNLYNVPLINEVYSEIINELNTLYPNSRVLDVRKMDDYSLTLSALLSAATDNAKELILAKINAGPELAGTYVYMMIQGIPFDSITDFMVSSTVDAVVAKSKSNIFTNKKSDIQKGIDHYLKSPNVRNYLNDKQLETFGALIDKKQSEFYKLINKEYLPLFQYEGKDGKIKFKKIGRNVQKFLEYVNKSGNLGEFIKKFNEFNLSKSGSYTDNYISSQTSDPRDVMFGPPVELKSYLNKPLQRYIKELEQVVNDFNEGVVDRSKLVEFEKIYKESTEINHLGRRLGINGGMGTSVYSHYSYNAGLSNYFHNKVMDIVNVTDESLQFNNEAADIKRSEYGAKQASIYKILNLEGITDLSEIEKIIEEHTNVRNFHKQIDPNNEQALIKHSQFQDRVIKLYEVVKDKFNIMQVEKEAPHYNAMMGAQNFAIDLFSNVSVGYEYTFGLMDELIALGYMKPDKKAKHKFTEEETKKITNFILSDLVNKFMDNANIEFVLPKGNYFYDEEYNYKYAATDIKLNLKDAHSRASFKLFMDKNKDNFRSISQLTEGNSFIDNLVADVKKDPLTGSDLEFIKLNLDMNNIKNDVDEIQFQEMSNGFRFLKSKPFSVLPGKSVADAFFIYNLIVNNNSFGKTAFTKIFENDLQQDEINIISEFFKFVGKVDYSKWTNSGSLYNNKIDYDYLGMLLAEPKTDYDDLKSFQGKFVKVWDNDNKMYKFGEYYVEKTESGFSQGYAPIALTPTGDPRIVNSNILRNIPTKLYLLKQSGNTNYDVATNNIIFSHAALTRIFDEKQEGNIKLIIKCD